MHKLLVEKANVLLGGEMIYELCQKVQDYLYQNNKPPAKSFYEQRLESKLEQHGDAGCNEDEKKVKDQLVRCIKQKIN